MPHPTNPNIRCDRCDAFQPPASSYVTGLCRAAPEDRGKLPDDWCRKFALRRDLQREVVSPAPDLARASQALIHCRAALAALQPHTTRLPEQVERACNSAFWDADAILRNLFPQDDHDAPRPERTA